jgi:hypothetical protein
MSMLRDNPVKRAFRVLFFALVALFFLALADQAAKNAVRLGELGWSIAYGLLAVLLIIGVPFGYVSMRGLRRTAVANKVTGSVTNDTTLGNVRVILSFALPCAVIALVYYHVHATVAEVFIIVVAAFFAGFCVFSAFAMTRGRNYLRPPESSVRVSAP